MKKITTDKLFEVAFILILLGFAAVLFAGAYSLFIHP